MAINTSAFEASLQAKFDTTTDPKEMLLLGKALESTVGSIAVSDINTAGATKISEINAVSSNTFKTVGGTSILGSGDIATLPSQSGASGKVLKSDGTNATWGTDVGGKVLGSAVGYATSGVQATSSLSMEYIRGGMLNNVGVAQVSFSYTPVSSTSRLFITGNMHYGITGNATGYIGLYVNGTSVSMMAGNGYGADGGAGSISGYWENSNTNAVTVEMRVLGTYNTETIRGGMYRYIGSLIMEQNSNRGVLQLIEVEA